MSHQRIAILRVKPFHEPDTDVCCIERSSALASLRCAFSRCAGNTDSADTAVMTLALSEFVHPLQTWRKLACADSSRAMVHIHITTKNLISFEAAALVSEIYKHASSKRSTSFITGHTRQDSTSVYCCSTVAGEFNSKSLTDIETKQAGNNMAEERLLPHSRANSHTECVTTTRPPDP